jgi:hypothetical protein
MHASSTSAAASTHSLRVALEPPERARYWSRVLDVSEAELRSVVGEVGPRAHRVCARLWELRQPGAQGGQCAQEPVKHSAPPARSPQTAPLVVAMP